MYVKNLKKHSNVKFQCPFKAVSILKKKVKKIKLYLCYVLPQHVNYEVKNMSMDEQDFPSFVPLGNFRSLIEYIINRKLRARITASGKIIPYATDPFKILT